MGVVMEKVLKGFTKFKLITILLVLCENKKNVDRIKSILETEIDGI